MQPTNFDKDPYTIHGQRRRYQRYQIKGCARIVFFHSRVVKWAAPKIVRLGPLVDIGLGGLAVEYLDTQLRSGDFRELAIELPYNGSHLYRFPFRQVVDYTIAQMNVTQQIRRRCMQFYDLNQHQVFRLQKFIDLHTCGPLMDRRSGKDRRYPCRQDDPFISLPGWQNDKGRRRKKDRRIIFAG